MHASQRPSANEPLQPFDAERELAQRERPLRGKLWGRAGFLWSRKPRSVAGWWVVLMVSSMS